MKIKLFALMFGIIHGAKMEIVQQGNGAKALFSSILYDFRTLWSDQPVDEEGNPLSIIQVLEKYYVTEVAIGDKLLVEINFVNINEIQDKNGIFEIAVFLKHKGPCPSSPFPHTLGVNGEQGANLYLELTFITLERLLWEDKIIKLLPLTAVRGQYDHVNLSAITELCEKLIKYARADQERLPSVLRIIDICKLPLIDFIAKYPDAFMKSEIDLIKQCKIINKVTSCYELAILLRIAGGIACDKSSSIIKYAQDQKINIQRLLAIYFDDIEKQTEKINISDKYNKIIEEFIEEQKIDDNGNGVSYFEDILNKVNAGGASNEDQGIITAFWETCNTKNITNKVKMYFAIKAFWKKYNIDDNGSGLRQMTNKILEIILMMQL